MADTREITATLVVNFGEGAASEGDTLIAEVDDRPTGLNGGKTRFSPGDDVYILLYKGSNVVLNEPLSSAGYILPRPALSPQFVEQEQDIQFVDEIEASLRYPIPEGIAGTGVWLGYDLGNVTQRSEIKLGIPEQVDEHWVGQYRFNHVAQPDVYLLTNTYLEFEEYSIICYFTGIAS